MKIFVSIKTILANMREKHISSNHKRVLKIWSLVGMLGALKIKEKKMNTQFPNVDTPAEWKFLATASTDSSTSEQTSPYFKNIKRECFLYYLPSDPEKLSRSSSLISLCIFTRALHKSCILPLISHFLEQLAALTSCSLLE